MHSEIGTLAFVGFGEAAYHLAKGLREAGVAHTFAFDIHAGTPGLRDKIRARARESGTELVDSSAALAAAANILFCAVTADQTERAASQTAPHLSARHLYADINSVSPATKQRAAKIVSATGARFVEVAVMSAIPPYGHQAPMLLGGPAAPEFQELLTPYGMRMEVVSADRIGSAIAVKMFRSVVYKGLEALLFECVLGASRYGAERRVFDSLDESFPGMNWKALADYMIGRVVVHGERRAREMDEAARTLEELGIEPLMAAATARRMDWAAALGLRENFGGEFPETFQQVLEAIERHAAAKVG
jgi:3-hydroxyisobutyrate dehydrogenase-like beta-hydroxyacid dehydrogenase